MKYTVGTNYLYTLVYRSLVRYPCPKNMKYSWNIGIVLVFFLMIQLLSGIVMTCFYDGTIYGAYASIEYIVRDVSFGHIIRSMHANTASFFFLFIYCHMLRGLYYNIFKFPRTVIWMSGLCTYILLAAIAFFGYVLPWGQMSYWAATVITNLITVLPVVGQHLLFWLWGGYSIGNGTLHRIYTVHFLAPLLLVVFVCVHLYVLHKVGSLSELGITSVSVSALNKYTSFYAYYIVKDIFVLLAVVLVLSIYIYFYPNFFIHPDNYIPANILVTPVHIVPEWYFLPFYGILRSVLEKSNGLFVTLLLLSFIVFLPYVYTTVTYYVIHVDFVYRMLIGMVALFFICIGIVGSVPASYPSVETGIFLIFVLIGIYVGLYIYK